MRTRDRFVLFGMCFLIAFASVFIYCGGASPPPVEPPQVEFVPLDSVFWLSGDCFRLVQGDGNLLTIVKTDCP